MLKEIVFLFWVCTPATDGAPGVIDCRPAALTAHPPAVMNKATITKTCNALENEATKMWGTGGTLAPDFATPVACFGVDYLKTTEPK